MSTDPQQTNAPLQSAQTPAGGRPLVTPPPEDRNAGWHPRASERRIRVLGRQIRVPNSKPGRLALGGGLVIGGMLGFLPVLGFWMLPLGLLVLAHDIGAVRRWRRRLLLRLANRGRRRTR